MQEALAILIMFTRAANAAGELIRKAQAEGRDLTRDELETIRQIRNDANADFERELERRRNEG